MKLMIGIAGKKRSGKDTVANYLVNGYRGFSKESFAEPIRNFVCQILGITLPELELCKEIPQPKFGDVTPRHMMQTLGTEWGRKMVDDQLWMKALAARTSYKERIAICDVRFENECEWIRQQGGWIIHLRRPETDSAGDEHESEKTLDVKLTRGDLVVINQGTYEDLEKNVKWALEIITARMNR